MLYSIGIFENCPKCNQKTLPANNNADVRVCEHCKCMVDKNNKRIGIINDGKPIYDSVEKYFPPFPLPLPKNYGLENIRAGDPSYELASIENAETGIELKPGDIIPKHIVLKISYR